MKPLWSRLFSMFRSKRLDAELDSEVNLHLSLLEKEYRDLGLGPEEARRAAHRDFGGVTQVKETYRDARGLAFLETLWQDLRMGLRMARRSRSLSTAVILTFLLGIGANTAAFSVIYSVLLKPLPYRDPDRLVWISEYYKAFRAEIVSGPDFADWRRLSRSFDSMAALTAADLTLTAPGDPTRIRVVTVSETLGRLLGVQPALGRDFSPVEMTPGGPRTVIISRRLHQELFSGNPSAVGKTIALNGQALRVIGVLRADFRLPLPGPVLAQTEADAIVSFPVDFDRQRRDGPMSIVQVLGRLKPGVALPTARAELQTIVADVGKHYRDPGGPDSELRMVPLLDHIVGGTRRSLLVLWAAVLLVLLIACVNVTNLLLASSAARTRESAIRAALGAGRFRLIRQKVAESVVLACGGGIVGVLLAYLVVGVLAKRSPIDIPRLRDASLDGTALAFTLAVCCIAGVIAGILPAISSSRLSLAEVMKGGGAASGLHRSRKLHGALVSAEVAFAFVLVIGAGLMLKSLWAFHAAGASFEPDRVLTGHVDLFDPAYRDSARENQFVSETVARIDAIPKVYAAAAWATTESIIVQIAGMPKPAPAHVVIAPYVHVTPQFFAAAGVRLLAGRFLTDDDQKATPRTAIVNETLTRRFFPQFPQELPIGRQINVDIGPNQTPVWATIVGVVADFRPRPDAVPEPQVFLPHTQNPFRFGVNLVVRSGEDPTRLAGAIRGIVQRVPQVHLVDPQTMEEQLTVAGAPRRFQAMLLAAFAAIALLLALVGAYGVLSYAVAQRRREIGLRMAIGAREADVFGMVLTQGMKWAGAGVAAGLAGALAVTRWIESLLYGVKPTDAWIFTAVSVGFLGVSALAAYIPARRAVRVDPVLALRYE